MNLSDKHTEIPQMRPREYIKVRGANEHNLKNLNLDIPRNELVVFTGLSGSGKSFLAKEEMAFVALSTEDDILVVDPKREVRHEVA